MRRPALLAGVFLCAASAHAANLPATAARGITDLGRAPASTQIHLALTLGYRDQAGLDALVQAQATPGSPQYRRYLTAEQFNARFAPSPDEYASVVAALQRAGLQVVQTYENRTVIDAAGSAQATEAYFSTEIHSVSQAGHGTRYANLTPATMPAELASIVRTVLGLDNIVRLRPLNRRVATMPHGAPDVTTSAQPIERTSGGAFAGIYPGGLAAAYKFPSLSGYTGTGHGIGIVIDSDIANADLSTFWSAAGVKRTGTFSRVLVGGTNPGVNADVGETAIDTETTSGLNPGSNITVYLVSSLDDTPIEDAYNMAVSAHVVDVVSSSFGGCEPDDTPFATATNMIAEQGAAKGITFTASSGDAGGYCEDSTASGSIYYEPDIISTPAADPYFLAVGGTALKINASTGARTSETAWSPGGASGGGGGGVSSFWALPSYQSGVTGVAVVPTITAKPPNSQPKSGFKGRNVPDISMDASNATGSYIAVYDTPDGGWTGYGGTSVANPIFASLVAQQNQKTGSPAGFLNTALYATFTANGSKPAGVYGTDFYDVKSGSVGAGWSAKAGFDQATGIGTIKGGTF